MVALETGSIEADLVGNHAGRKKVRFQSVYDDWVNEVGVCPEENRLHLVLSMIRGTHRVGLS